MQQPKTPYQVLNVAPDAEPEVIDAAYRVLMKKYHPDKLAGGAPLSESKAAEINDAFRILRDPAKRARHDADEKARKPVTAGADWAFDPSRGAPFATKPESAASPARATRPPPPPPPYMRSLVVMPQRRNAPRIVGWASLLAVLVLIAIAIAQGQGAGLLGVGSVEKFKSGAWMTGGQPARFRSQAPVSRDRIEQALVEFDRVRSVYGPVGVLAYSDACFDAQSRSRNLSDLDFCVAFDHAANAADDVSEVPGAQRLTADQLDSHHIAKAELSPQDYGRIEGRLSEIKAVTYSAISGRAVAATAVNAQPAQPGVGGSAVRVPAPQRYAPTQPPSGSRRPPASNDAEFLEREGGIY